MRRLSTLWGCTERASWLLACLIVGLVASSLATGRAGAAPALVQQQTASVTGGTSTTATLGATATSGRLLIAVCAANGSATISTPSGYSTALNQTGTVSQAIFYKISNGTETALTCTFSASLTIGAHIYEYSGVHSYQAYEGANVTASTGNSNAESSGTVTTVHTNDLLFAAVANDSGGNGTTWNNSFTGLTGGGFGQNNGKPSSRGVFAAAHLIVTSAGSYTTTASVNSSGNWRGQIVAFRSLAASPSLGADIVNGSGTPVASPSVALTTLSKSFNCQTSTGTLGVTAQKIRVNNTTDNPAWSLTIAATSGPTTLWSDGGGHSYDFNDAAGSGCTNGQLTVSAGGGTLTPQTNCTNTNVALGSVPGLSRERRMLLPSQAPPRVPKWTATGI